MISAVVVGIFEEVAAARGIAGTTLKSV